MDPGPWIPIVALLIGGIAVVGRVIVQPVVSALLKISEQRQGVAGPAPDTARLEQRVNAIEERLLGMERSVDRLIEDREFLRQLNAGEGPRP